MGQVGGSTRWYSSQGEPSSVVTVRAMKKHKKASGVAFVKYAIVFVAVRSYPCLRDFATHGE